MKRFIALMLVLAVLTVLAGCGAFGKPGAAKTEKTEFIPGGVLRVATSPDFAPMEFVDPERPGQEQFVGFDMNLARYIAAEMGVELQILPMDFGASQDAVRDGRVDMAISGFCWTEEREALYNLSDYYHAAGNTDRQILIAPADKTQDYRDAASFAGARIGVQQNSLQQTLTIQQLPDSQSVPFTGLDAGVELLLAGDVDCLAVADANGDAIIAQYPQLGKCVFSYTVEEKYTGNVILLQKGNDVLTLEVNRILKKASVYFGQWYAQACSTAGIQVVYDPDGNPLGMPGETNP